MNERFPEPVLQAIEAGFNVVPVDIDKKPRVKWKSWGTERQTPEDLETLGHGSLWAIVTGELNDTVILDFDGAEGMATLERLGLEPTVMTPSGAHVYVRHPGWPVKSSAKAFDEYPGLDIKGDRSLAYFHGRSKKGSYEPVEWPPFHELLDDEVVEDLFPHPQAEVAPSVEKSEFIGYVPEASRYLERACQDVRHADQGASNAALNKAAYTVGGLVASGQLEEGDAFDALVEAAEDRDCETPATVIVAAMNSGAERPWKFDPVAEDDWVPSITLRLFSNKGVPPVIDFPTRALPEDLAKLVEDGARALSCPPDYLGTALLPALGTAIGGHVQLQITETWFESAMIWAAVVGKPGTLKSPAIKMVMRPVWDAQKAHREAAEEENRRASEDEDFLEVKAPRLVVDDSTIEALFGVLEGNPRGLILAPDELVGWVKGMGQYKGGGGRDRQHWLSIWSRRPIQVDRVKGADRFIENPFVCALGGIQAEPLEELIHGEDDGLLPRLLLAYGTPGVRTLGRGRLDMNLTDTYHDIWDRVRDRGIVERVVQFTQDGYDAFELWANDHYAKIPELPAELIAAWSKLDGQCARICLILAEVEETDVDRSIVERAVALIRYYQGQAAGLLQGSSGQTINEKKSASRTKALAKLIAENPGADRAELMILAPEWALDSKTFDRHLETLEGLGVWRNR